MIDLGQDDVPGSRGMVDLVGRDSTWLGARFDTTRYKDPRIIQERALVGLLHLH